jgi:hypothetical protein
MVASAGTPAGAVAAFCTAFRAAMRQSALRLGELASFVPRAVGVMPRSSAAFCLGSALVFGAQLPTGFKGLICHLKKQRVLRVIAVSIAWGSDPSRSRDQMPFQAALRRCFCRQ